MCLCLFVIMHHLLAVKCTAAVSRRVRKSQSAPINPATREEGVKFLFVFELSSMPLVFCCSFTGSERSQSVLNTDTYRCSLKMQELDCGVNTELCCKTAHPHGQM